MAESTESTVITVDDVTNYLGIDYVDDMIQVNINRMIKTADAYLRGSIGQDYPVDDPRSKELALIIVADLYDNRQLNSTVSGNIRKLVNDLSLQLKMELRKKSNEKI